MAAVTRPETESRVARADMQLPAIRSYTRVNDDIIATLRGTRAWLPRPRATSG